MTSEYKLNSKEAILLILMIMSNKLILNIPYYIINNVNSGSIINIIYICIVDFIVLLLIIKLFKKFQHLDIIDIAEFIGGKFLKWIISLITISLFFLGAFITLYDFEKVLETIYYSNFSNFYILLFFLISILISNLTGFKNIIKFSNLISIISICGIIITFFANLNNITLEELTPILGKSIDQTFIKGLSNTFSMYIIIFYYFLKPIIKESENFEKIVIRSYIYSCILLITTIIPLLSFLSFNTYEPINSLLLLAKTLELGNFIQRLDAIFILIWIFEILTYLSFMIFLINKIFKKLTNISNSKMLSYANISILFGLTIIPFSISDIIFIENIIYRYFTIIYMFGIGIILLLIGNIKKGNT